MRVYQTQTFAQQNKKNQHGEGTIYSNGEKICKQFFLQEINIQLI